MEYRSHPLFETYRNSPEYRRLPKPIVIADNIRTPENMGSILRLAANIGAVKTLFVSEVASGFKQYKINKTASGAAGKTHWNIIGPEELRTEIPEDYTIIALETTSEARNLFTFQFPEKTALIVGNEVNGISEKTLSLAKHHLAIPVPGPVSSLNVSHALSVALFEWLRQMKVI